MLKQTCRKFLAKSKVATCPLHSNSHEYSTSQIVKVMVQAFGGSAWLTHGFLVGSTGNLSDVSAAESESKGGAHDEIAQPEEDLTRAAPLLK